MVSSLVFSPFLRLRAASAPAKAIPAGNAPDSSSLAIALASPVAFFSPGVVGTFSFTSVVNGSTFWRTRSFEAVALPLIKSIVLAGFSGTTNSAAPSIRFC